MKYDDLRDHFDSSTIIESVYYNPLRVAEVNEFNKKDAEGCYRERAIDFVNHRRMPYSSTCNSSYELFKRYVSVTCPYCRGATKVVHGGGAGGSMTIDYQCVDCGAEISLNVPDGGALSIRPYRGR